jgi:hypothetical protein
LKPFPIVLEAETAYYSPMFNILNRMADDVSGLYEATEGGFGEVKRSRKARVM